VKKALVAAVVVALCAAGSAAAATHIGGIDTSGYPTIRVAVVAPLGSAAPTIRENGFPVVGMSAVNLGQGKSVVLAVDRSQSMAGRSLRDAKTAARAFIAARSPGDKIEVVGFGRQAVALTRFTDTPGEQSSVLAGLTTDAHSGTALYDAIVLAAHGLQQQGAAGHVIVVLTDGRDVSSSASLDGAVRAANAAHASVYAIGIEGHDFTPDALRTLARRTGGQYMQAASTAELAALYASVGDQLARTWEVRYATAARPGDSITVSAAVRGSGNATKSAAIDAAGVGVVPVPPPTVLQRGAWVSSYMPVLIAVGFGLLMLLSAAFIAASRTGLWLTARLAPHLGPSENRKGRRPRTRQRGFRHIFASTEQVFANVKQFRALQALLTRADLPLMAAELLYICLGAGVVLGLFFAVAGMPPLLVVGFMLVGAVLPILAVMFKASARVKAFDNQLPDLLITIAASLKAGHSFRHAIQSVVDEGVEPAAKEFKRVLTETQLGRPMDTALADMGERIGSKHLAFVLTAVTIQRQIGGSLAGLFDMVAETVRQRQQFARKIRGLTAMGRMSAYVLAGLPFFLALTITLMNPSYMAPLWGSPTGHELIFIALGMLAFGALILKKIVSFKG
jgi:tight adherence protein B